MQQGRVTALSLNQIEGAFLAAAGNMDESYHHKAIAANHGGMCRLFEDETCSTIACSGPVCPATPPWLPHLFNQAFCDVA